MAGGAAAAEFPTISIERTCRAAKPLDAQDTAPVETCMRDEREARAQLQAQWGGFAESNRNVCLQQTYVGDYPSYDDVLTCCRCTVRVRQARAGARDASSATNRFRNRAPVRPLRSDPVIHGRSRTSASCL
jgi:hypothetical protein